jgi:hypothetical protein
VFVPQMRTINSSVRNTLHQRLHCLQLLYARILTCALTAAPPPLLRNTPHPPTQHNSGGQGFSREQLCAFTTCRKHNNYDAKTAFPACSECTHFQPVTIRTLAVTTALSESFYGASERLVSVDHTATFNASERKANTPRQDGVRKTRVSRAAPRTPDASRPRARDDVRQLQLVHHTRAHFSEERYWTGRMVVT